MDLAVNLLYYPIVAVLLLALFLRRPESERKRHAMLGWAGLLLAVRAAAWLVSRLRAPWVLVLVPLGALAALAWVARGFLFPFRLSCARCGERLSAARVLTDGDNLCDRCAAARGDRNEA